MSTPQRRCDFAVYHAGPSEKPAWFDDFKRILRSIELPSLQNLGHNHRDLNHRDSWIPINVILEEDDQRTASSVVFQMLKDYDQRVDDFLICGSFYDTDPSKTPHWRIRNVQLHSFDAGWHCDNDKSYMTVLLTLTYSQAEFVKGV